MGKEPLYPHVPRSRKDSGENMPNNLGKAAREVEESIRRQGRLHMIDIGKIAQRENVSLSELVKRLPEDITLDEKTGYLMSPSTPVHYGSIGFPLWTKAAERYGPDAANNITVKVDELLAAAKECKLTGPNGVFDHYDDLIDMVDELEEKLEPSSSEEYVSSELHKVTAKEVSATLNANCNCRTNSR